MNPVVLQVAFQGGGAKLPELLAFADALYAAQRDGNVVVSRISGTSAGAIAAAIFALCLVKGESVKSVAMLAKHKHGKQMKASVKVPSLAGMLSRLARGLPVVDFLAIRRWLDEEFSSSGISTIRDLEAKSGVRLHITKCNLMTRESVACPESSSIVSSLEDSAAIPFFFRTWRYQNASELFVDGGIASNLPIGFLSEGEGEHLLGVSFESKPPPRLVTIKDFFLALIDTAMGQMEADARARLPPKSVYAIKTDLSTFDFVKAIDVGLDDEIFGRAKDDAAKWLSERIDDIRAGSLPGLPNNMWLDDNETAKFVMSQAAEVYKTQEFPIKFRVAACKIVVEAEGLRERGDNLSNSGWDSIETTMRIAAVDRPVRSICLILYSREEKFYRAVPDVVVRRGGDDGERVGFILVPARFHKEEAEGAGRQIIVNFNDPIFPDDGEFTIVYRERVNGLVKLKRDQSSVEDMSFSPSRAFGSIGKIELVMFVPDDLADRITLTPMSTNGALPGRRLDSSELPDSIDGLRPIGWGGMDIPAGEDLDWGANFSLR